MKLTTKTLAGIVALAFSTLAAGHLQAQVPTVLAITGTQVLESNSNDNGTITTTPAPTRRPLTTKRILEILALDEYEAGKYTAKAFPPGAKLRVIISSPKSVFQVVDKNNNLLVDVSNIISINSGGINGTYLTSGKENDTTGLPSPSRTIVNLLTFRFDDSHIAGSVGFQFYMTGVVSGTTTDTTPNPATKVYTETKSIRMSNAAGEGIDKGQAFVFTCNLSGSGKATLTLP